MKRRLYLICYDITDPNRLGKVGRFMVKHAIRVQYSVFAAELNAIELQMILAGLEGIIDRKTDDVRAYPLPRQGEVALRGRQMFPDDVLLIEDGPNLLRLREQECEEKVEQFDFLAID